MPWCPDRIPAELFLFIFSFCLNRFLADNPAVLLKIMFLIGIFSRILPGGSTWQHSEQLFLKTPFLRNTSSGCFHFSKNTFYPEHLHWLLPVFSNNNYFFESILLVYSISIIRCFIEVRFDRKKSDLFTNIYASSCFVSWKTCFNIAVTVIS